MVEKPELADYIIESIADTQEDASSDVLDKNYNLKLASLIINLQLKNKLNNNETFKTQVKDIFGYANGLEKAGLNAYDNPKLNTNLMEALFFLKRKMLVYWLTNCTYFLPQGLQSISQSTQIIVVKMLSF